MNTKVKVGIAAVIVAALVALIVLDQKTGTPEPARTADEAAPAVLTPDAAAQRVREEEIKNILQKFPNPNVTPPSETRIKEPPTNSGKEIAPLRDDEYVIQEGDTLESIAEKKYGSRASWTLIAQANPGLKASALRPGKTIKIPARPEKKADEAPKLAADAVVVTPGGPKVYTVQPGDSLSAIAQKTLGSARHWEKLHEANRDAISDPSTLSVGMKLVVPDLPAAKAGPATTGGTVQTAAAPLPGSKVHAVQSGESLWKIAEKYAGDRGILDMMKAIVVANADKLKDGDKTLLRLGWSLVIPE
jgi:nucleoid-associated protein YgaU